MHRTVTRRPVALSDRRFAHWVWLAALWCAVVVSACAGGSGSSGFDPLLRENRAIDTALETQGCEENEGLTICPSGSEPPSPVPTATVPHPARSRTPTPSPSFTPVQIGSVTPTVGTATPTGSVPPASLTATVPASESPTPTPTEPPIAGQPNVDTNVGPGDMIQCQLNDRPAERCFFVFTFQPAGLPSAALYSVAVRTRDPDSNWLLLPVVDNSALIEVDTSPSGPGYQIAVLVFLQEPPVVPETVELLADTGADYAFVTPVLTPEAF